MAMLRPTGKATESKVAQMLRKAYKLQIDIQ